MMTAESFSPVDVVLPVVVVVLLAISALLALAETALVRTGRAKAKSLADDGKRGAKVLVRLTEDPQGFLNPVLLLVLICQLVVATLVGILAVRWFGAWGVVAATVFEIVVIFVFAEAVPKNWAVHHPERAALFSAPIVSVVVGFWPVKMVSGGLNGLANLFIGKRDGYSGALVTESELLAMADVAVEGDVIETEERALIHSIIEFGDTVVREVMVPRTDMVTISGEVAVEAALDVALGAGRSRLPAIEQQIDDVIGIAYTKDMIRVVRTDHGDEPIASHVRAAHFVPETKRVADLMREMQSEQFHLAVVVNEYGGTAGLVTLEDLIEELVGEIVDEFDVEEIPIEHLASGGLRVSGRLAVDEVNDLLESDLPTGAWDTVGGLVFDLLGHVPVPGESVTSEGLRLEVDEVSGRRIERVSIVPVAGRSGGDASVDAEAQGR
jgi:putative hemolysin